MAEWSSKLVGRSFWVGLALGMAGGQVLAVIILFPHTSDTLRFWLLSEGARPRQLMPLVGFGAALGLAPPRLRVHGACAAFVGAATGLLLYRTLLEPLWVIPNIAAHHFLVAPVSSLSAGVALISGRRFLPLVIPLSAFLVGLASATAVVISDPSIGGITIRIVGQAMAVWVVGTSALITAGLVPGWRGPVGAILGSWLIAIGLLYGTFALIPKQPTPAPARAFVAPNRLPEMDQPAVEGGERLPP
jgi:hypothetical protein